MSTTTPIVAMGDPQAPFAHVQRVLAHHGLLSSARRPRILPGRRLLSIGDHFDWGSAHHDTRAAAAVDGEACLRWLASHDEDQVVILAGNHDLARVGELFGLSDDAFAKLQEVADRHYHHGAAREDEEAFFRQCSFLPSTEIVARDLSTYRASQQRLVLSLLRRRRLRVAWAEQGLLFSHAGITRRALWHLGLPEHNTPEVVANALNAALDAAVDDCLRGRRQKPLSIKGLHRPADGIGEGDGVFYHRPRFVEADQWIEPRRFDPRHLPRGLWQVVGHVRDKRLVQSLGPWSVPKQHVDGVLRHLIVVDDTVTYRHGPPPPRADVSPEAAVMIFIDGAMNLCAPEVYELLDTATCAAVQAQ
jgi:hypothetical protein